METRKLNDDSIEVIVSKKQFREIATPEQVQQLINQSGNNGNQPTEPGTIAENKEQNKL